MIDLDQVKNRCIAIILDVNDLCPDSKHKRAMRGTVMATINAAFAEVKVAVDDNQTGQDRDSRGGDSGAED